MSPRMPTGEEKVTTIIVMSCETITNCISWNVDPSLYNCDGRYNRVGKLFVRFVRSASPRYAVPAHMNKLEDQCSFGGHCNQVT
jgi:hypothetical protein